MNNSIEEIQEIKMYNLQLNGLAGTMQGSEYVVDFLLKGFVFTQKKQTFSIESLEKLFIQIPPNKIDGIFIQTSFELIKSTINDALSCIGGSSDYDAIYYPKARALVFWDIIQQAFDLPPDICLEYKQKDHKCIFDLDWVMWDYCFILIKNNNGIVLACGAGPY